MITIYDCTLKQVNVIISYSLHAWHTGHSLYYTLNCETKKHFRNLEIIETKLPPQNNLFLYGSWVECFIMGIYCLCHLALVNRICLIHTCARLSSCTNSFHKILFRNLEIIETKMTPHNRPFRMVNLVSMISRFLKSFFVHEFIIHIYRNIYNIHSRTCWWLHSVLYTICEFRRTYPLSPHIHTLTLTQCLVLTIQRIEHRRLCRTSASCLCFRYSGHASVTILWILFRCLLLVCLEVWLALLHRLVTCDIMISIPCSMRTRKQMTYRTQTGIQE